jgi:2-polyprenyl-3-methyl-5-hydroxy-6-metoxy-1,4-benzoquinol methylase
MSAIPMQRIPAFYQRRWDRHYAAAKLRTDPLYTALARDLHNSHLPLLDVGCGIGLSAFFLRAHAMEFPIHGLDYDARKIRSATRAAEAAGLTGVTFAQHDARNGLPEHQGNVCILDILQFFTPCEQETLLNSAAALVPPGGMLLIRSGIRDDSRRFKITVAGDRLAKATRWMKAPPTHYPSHGDFERILTTFGKVKITPLWGKTPFNNHWIRLQVAESGGDSPAPGAGALDDPQDEVDPD